MRTSWKISVSCIALALAAVLWRPWAASATLAPLPCAGNVCVGTLVIGGQTVHYSYTQHVAPSGQFRLRLNGGVYNTAQLVSFIASGLPAFAAWDKSANPVGGAIYLLEEDVNPGRTAYERRATTGVSGQIVDQVMSMTYAGAAPGAYAFNLTVIQNGASGGTFGLAFYIDAAAPTNLDESFAWATVPGMDLPCSDGIDNDLDFKADCADTQCAGQRGDAGSLARCESPETTCNDGFDNDGNGLKDCLDPSCNGRVGQPSGTALCQFGNEFGAASCGDGFDNDGDGLNDCYDNQTTDGNATHACWKQSSYGCPAVENCSTVADDDKDMSYDQSYDAVATTGANCQDYDCTGNAACPNDESKKADGTAIDEQCFDGLDNDLDHLVDCADPNCAGKINPGNSSQRCYTSEFSLVGRYQMCSNSFDDNGNGPKDCADASCKQQFGNCGPCPSREDFSINACADHQDNDTDGMTDCKDADCNGRFGTLTAGSAAYCAATESTDDLCSDGFDNNHNGLIDCADPACRLASRIGPQGQVCGAENTVATCSDGLDNDGDGRLDCGDSGCIGIGACAAKTYTDATCQVVPSYLGPTAFTGNDPTVLATVTAVNHVSATDTLHFTGSATYSSVTIIVGDNLVPSNYYPYADATNCHLTGPSAGSFGLTAVATHALQIFNTASGVTNFDFTLTCPTTATPTARRDYPISLSALKQPGNQAEYGDVSFYTTLLEATPPVVSKIEGEGELPFGTIKVPYAGIEIPRPEGRRFRGVADDPPPGGPPNSSGICHCDVEITGTTYTQNYSTLSDCYTPSLGFERSDVITIRSRAEDGSNNVGAWYGTKTVNVIVTPAVKTQLTLTSSSPFVRDGSMRRGLAATFLTGTNVVFPPSASCDVYIRTAAGAIIVGPMGPTLSFAPKTNIGNMLECDQQVDLSSALSGQPDGTYFVTMKATDSGPNSVETERRPIIVCNHVPQATGAYDPSNVCNYADFDNDGAAEGLFSTLYSTEPRTCDNCVGLPNIDQTDLNANGIGDACEPTKTFGRCEVDRDIVCECDSDKTCDYPCPFAPYNDTPVVPLEDPTKQQCKDSWGVCIYKGQVCFDDSECNEVIGTCAGDGATACHRDVDCEDAGTTGPCNGGPDRCENMLYPWFQSLYGNIFSRSRIYAPDLPPQDQFNATYCIVAKDTISNFSSQLCAPQSDATVRFTFPKRANLYSTVLGRIDVAGLRSGKYGDVIELPAGTDVGAYISNNLGHQLGGRVLRVSGDATMSATSINNDATDGSGTVFVDGGNLTITGDVSYSSNDAATLRGLGSLGLLVIDTDPTTAKGAIYIDRNVVSLVGDFYAEGQDGIWSVAPPYTESKKQLTVYGLMMAYQFHFNRSYKSMTQGSERIIYDGRAVANPPPGFGDLGKALPQFTDSAQ